jgi:hypothetical protein
MQFMTILEIGGLPKAEKKEDKTRNHMLGTAYCSIWEEGGWGRESGTAYSFFLNE